MKTSKLILFAFACTLTMNASAQGFARFTANGVKGSIKNIKNKPSKVEVIVGADTDLKNIDFKYKLLSDCSMDGTITADFSKPQEVTINKNDGTSKEWVIEVKKLAPASLPLEIEFSKTTPAIWTSETKGWVNQGTDESKPTVIRFGNSNVTFTAAFEGEAKEVSFDLNAVGKAGDKFDGSFAVETSADGVKWEKLNGFKDKDITIDSKFSCKLNKNARFVRWTYTERIKQNINLNNISIK
ncbi:MAG: hypothetical protein ACRCSQ_04595 [Bacteroidales bacterium]